MKLDIIVRVTILTPQILNDNILHAIPNQMRRIRLEWEKELGYQRKH